jgi:hypothetical protein
MRKGALPKKLSSVGNKTDRVFQFKLLRRLSSFLPSSKEGKKRGEGEEGEGK